jgi:hypothetical protein
MKLHAVCEIRSTLLPDAASKPRLPVKIPKIVQDAANAINSGNGNYIRDHIKECLIYTTTIGILLDSSSASLYAVSRVMIREQRAKVKRRHASKLPDLYDG